MNDEPTNQPPEYKPSRVEDILLERLKNEPKICQQVATPILVSIIIGIIGLGFAIYFIAKKPEKFAENPHAAEQQKDSSELNAKRLRFAPMIDSLASVITSNPQNDTAHLMLANVYYECEFWGKSKSEYEYYLSKHPQDVDARVDHAFTIAQADGDFKAAVEEIESGLKYDPEHLNALFNAGILAARAHMDDKRKGLTVAKGYFVRARAAAKKQGNDKMASQIDQILKEIEKPVSEEKGE